MRFRDCFALGLLAFSITSRSAKAGDVVVTISGVNVATGEIACALFSDGEGFPLGISSATLQRAPTRIGGEACRFHDLKPGAYALAVSQLAAGQTNVERDLLDRPKQPWGVSNNVRPALRAPTFEEAEFRVEAQGETRISVQLAR
jgi:uncharacterized protein (DUF2141 family)